MVEKLRGKSRHGMYADEVRMDGVEKKATMAWIREGKLTPRTMAFMMAAQDQVLMTKEYISSFPTSPSDPKCRLCGSHAETLGHLLAKCPIFEYKEYKKRHDSVLYLLARAIAQKLELKLPQDLKCPEGGVRSGIMTAKDKTVLVDLCVPTDRAITARRPDLIVRQVKEKKITIFEVACSWDPKVEKREREKYAKYADPAADLAKQWEGFRVTVVPVVIGDLGLIRNMRRQIKKANILNVKEIARFAAEAQREVQCWAVKILKRTLAVVP